MEPPLELCNGVMGVGKKKQKHRLICVKKKEEKKEKLSNVSI